MDLHEQINTKQDSKVLTHEDRIKIIMKPFPTFNIIKPTKSTASYGPINSASKSLSSD